MESLILAQNERWRRGLGMQVERIMNLFMVSGDLVSTSWVTCPEMGDNFLKGKLIPHVVAGSSDPSTKGFGRFRMGPVPISLLVR